MEQEAWSVCEPAGLQSEPCCLFLPIMGPPFYHRLSNQWEDPVITHTTFARCLCSRDGSLRIGLKASITLMVGA